MTQTSFSMGRDLTVVRVGCHERRVNHQAGVYILPNRHYIFSGKKGFQGSKKRIEYEEKSGKGGTRGKE